MNIINNKKKKTCKTKDNTKNTKQKKTKQKKTKKIEGGMLRAVARGQSATMNAARSYSMHPPRLPPRGYGGVDNFNPPNPSTTGLHPPSAFTSSAIDNSLAVPRKSAMISVARAGPPAVRRKSAMIPVAQADPPAVLEYIPSLSRSLYNASQALSGTAAEIPVASRSAVPVMRDQRGRQGQRGQQEQHNRSVYTQDSDEESDDEAGANLQDVYLAQQITRPSFNGIMPELLDQGAAQNLATRMSVVPEDGSQVDDESARVTRRARQLKTQNEGVRSSIPTILPRRQQDQGPAERLDGIELILTSKQIPQPRQINKLKRDLIDDLPSPSSTDKQYIFFKVSDYVYKVIVNKGLYAILTGETLSSNHTKLDKASFGSFDYTLAEKNGIQSIDSLNKLKKGDDINITLGYNVTDLEWFGDKGHDKEMYDTIKDHGLQYVNKDDHYYYLYSSHEVESYKFLKTSIIITKGTKKTPPLTIPTAPIYKPPSRSRIKLGDDITDPNNNFSTFDELQRFLENLDEFEIGGYGL